MNTHNNNSNNNRNNKKMQYDINAQQKSARKAEMLWMKPHFVFLKLRFAFLPCNNFLPKPKINFLLLALTVRVSGCMSTIAANKYNVINATAPTLQLIDQILSCASALSFAQLCSLSVSLSPATC